MKGRETELPKTIVEAIKDPLKHMLRNALEHGVEMPASPPRLGEFRGKKNSSPRVSLRRQGKYRDHR